MKYFLKAKIPTISIIIGEGGSGGAIGIATADRVLMLEHSIYSVISPEGCASILWRSANESEKAAESLKLTAQDLLELEVIDEIIREPRGGAHRDVSGICNQIKECILRMNNEFDGVSTDKIISQREEKYLCIGKKFLIKVKYQCNMYMLC